MCALLSHWLEKKRFIWLHNLPYLQWFTFYRLYNINLTVNTGKKNGNSFFNVEWHLLSHINNTDYSRYGWVTKVDRKRVIRPSHWNDKLSKIYRIKGYRTGCWQEFNYFIVLDWCKGIYSYNSAAILLLQYINSSSFDVI